MSYLLIAVVAVAAWVVYSLHQMFVRRDELAEAIDDPDGAVELLRVGASLRAYYVHCANDALAPDQGRPLVIALHGGQGNAEFMARLTQFNALADSEGFCVAYPQAKRIWRDGRRTTGDGPSDVRFVARLIRRLESTHGIDVQRVYVTGVSAGGMMAHRLACELPDKLAACATVAANMPVDYDPPRAERAVPMMIISGTDDQFMPWAGGEIRKGVRIGFGGQVRSARATAELWCERNRCSTNPQSRHVEAAGQVEIYEYRGDAPEHCVVFVAIHGGGHTWPGVGGARFAEELGVRGLQWEASPAIWRFCQAYRCASDNT